MSNNSLLHELPVVAGKQGWPWTEEVNPEVYSSKQKWPKISIVTPSYNQGHFLEETIRSILLQNYPNLEYIITDGGSKDDTTHIINKYAKWITAWVSEKDNGQADAINKGVAKCTGEVFNWINSDDLLAKSALLTVGQLFKRNSTVAGSVLNFYDQDSSFEDVIENRDLDMANYLSLKCEFHQPGLWCDLNNIKSTGNFPVAYSYYFDKIYFTDYLLNHPEVIYTNNTLVHFRYHGDSKTVVIGNNRVDEMIGYYKSLMINPSFAAYKENILEALETKLLPEKHIAAWEQANHKSSFFARVMSYCSLVIRNPFLYKSRYYYTVFKRVLFSAA